MNEGNDRGSFEIKNVRLMAEIFHFCLKGCEVPFIYGRFAAKNEEELYPYVRNMILKQLKK